MFMFSFVVALSASAIASPAVYAEVESGVLQTVVTRPIRRGQVIIGKWLGLAFLVACYSFVVAALEMAVVDWVSGFLPQDPVAVAFYLFAEGAVLLTLGARHQHQIVDACHRGARRGAVRGRRGWPASSAPSASTFKIPALRTIGDVARYILPTDGLWHGAIYLPGVFVVHHPTPRGHGAGSGGNPFFALAPPSWPYLAYTAIWFLAVLGIGIISFERREL